MKASDIIAALKDDALVKKIACEHFITAFEQWCNGNSQCIVCHERIIAIRVYRNEILKKIGKEKP